MLVNKTEYEFLKLDELFNPWQYRDLYFYRGLVLAFRDGDSYGYMRAMLDDETVMRNKGKVDVLREGLQRYIDYASPSSEKVKAQEYLMEIGPWATMMTKTFETKDGIKTFKYDLDSKKEKDAVRHRELRKQKGQSMSAIGV